MMKKITMLSLLFLLGVAHLVAQENYEYVPFVREGVKWVYSYVNTHRRPMLPELEFGTVFLSLELKGDSVFNGKTYKAMHKYYGNSINTVNDTIPIYLREEDQVVYGYVPDGVTFLDCPIGDLGSGIIRNKIERGEEFVLYDFKDPETYWHGFFSPSVYEESDAFNLESTSYIKIGARMAKCYTFGDFKMIEGIGVDGRDGAYHWDGYTLYPMFPAAAISLGAGFQEEEDDDDDDYYMPRLYFYIQYVVENGEIIYKSVNYRESDGADEVAVDRTRQTLDPNYYDLTGRNVGANVPTAAGIYIHNGKKIIVR